MKIYDLNIWDKVGYETEYEQEGWHIGVYEVLEEGAPYGSGTFREDLSFDLTLDESKALTLGLHKNEGGRYAPDSDFWMDNDTFFDIYAGVIPPRVESLLKSLPD